MKYRAPAKVQSALLEAMQEKQVTIGDTSYALQAPSSSCTQNPIEQEGHLFRCRSASGSLHAQLKLSYPSKKRSSPS